MNWVMNMETPIRVLVVYTCPGLPSALLSHEHPAVFGHLCIDAPCDGYRTIVDHLNYLSAVYEASIMPAREAARRFSHYDNQPTTILVANLESMVEYKRQGYDLEESTQCIRESLVLGCQLRPFPVEAARQSLLSHSPLMN